jgi:hydrogenase expression/formation protein HypE
MQEVERIMMAHGGGGVVMRELIGEVIVKPLANEILRQMADSAVLDLGLGRIAFTTDSYVVQPLFFRGGDIGRLAVAGTVNDLAVVGARPVAISLAFILEEGFSIADLRRIVASIRATADEAGVRVVTGDTKVVGAGQADGLFINTSGVGVVPEGVSLGAAHIRPGDAVLINGPIAEHGVAIMSEREGLAFETPVVSDAAPLADLIAACLAAGEVRFMRDATRGGLAAVLNEMAAECRLTAEIDERAVPVTPAVVGACDLLGLDPFTVANEGKVVVVCARESASAVLAAMRAHPRGRAAACIGHVTNVAEPRVRLRTAFGGSRVLEMPYGEDVPRIC